MWEYCTLFKLDLDENPGMLEDGDRMRIEDYKTLMDFYFRNKLLIIKLVTKKPLWKFSAILSTEI